MLQASTTRSSDANDTVTGVVEQMRVGAQCEHEHEHEATSRIMSTSVFTTYMMKCLCLL